MSSLGGRFGYPNRSPYATTKRGLIGFAETLALELGGDDIRTNVIDPGAVERPDPPGPPGPGRDERTDPP